MRAYRGQIAVKNLRNLPIITLHDINAYTKFGENPLTFTRYHPETKIRTDGRTTDKRTDGLTDSQHDTIISRHYRVAGYKKFNVQNDPAASRCGVNSF